MKKFLLSILCCLLAVVNGTAEEVTKSVTFSKYTAGKQYAKNEKHDLGDGLVIYTTLCHFTTELRIYSSASNNGFVVSDPLPGTITKMAFNAGYNADKLLVYGGNNGTDWTLIGKITTAGSYKDYTLDFTGDYSRFKLDVEGTQQVRLKNMSVTYTTGSSTEPPKETVATPVISSSATTFNKGESVIVNITTETDGATIRYTTNGDTPTAETGDIYSEPFEVTTTTTVKAIAIKGGCNNSEVAEVQYIMVYPNAIKATISFTTTSHRVSLDENSQVWRNDNITFTNNKSESQSKVADYSNPVRLYQSSNIVVECASGNIAEIEFDCNNASYASALKNSIGNSAILSSDKVIISLDATSNNYTVATLAAQVRLDKITVSYIGETWGSLYLPIAIDIPEDVKAYIVTGAGSDYVSLTQITGALPANTGIIYYGAWAPNLSAKAVNNEADVTGNLLKGSFADTYITEEAYVLAKVDGEVGFYKAQMNKLEGTAFKNNANKAYLPVDALPKTVQGANGFKFRFETTGVESVQVAEGKKVIFDLSGRKVNDMKAPGLYIVNGKKVLVK